MSTTLKFPPKIPRRIKGRRIHDNALGLSEAAVAQQLGVSRRTVRSGIECGDIRTVTFAGRRYIPRSEIERIKQLFAQP